VNILISKYCNRRCTFCFAQQRLGKNAGGAAGNPFLSRDNLRRIRAVLKRSGETDLRLLGGEPTMHPEFVEIVREAVDDGFNIHIFTNGMMPAATADFLASLPPDRFSMLVNVSPQANDTPRQKEMVAYALGKLNTRAKLGITITGFDDDFVHIIETIDRYRLQRRVRVGIAQPIVGQANAYLHPSRYREAGTYIVSLAEKFYGSDILIGFDCGMTLCMFDEAQIGRLFTISEGLRMLCNPIIDVGPDMDVWHCFPLSEVLITRVDAFACRNEMVSHYHKAVKPYRSLGCKPECLRCRFFRTKQCTGGCLAHAMNALDRRPPALLPES
jgi:radical SAM protein with 4Fe4S-binding SPASM domain